VDAVIIGNHEFDRGALNLARQFRQWATYDILAANYQWDDPSNPGSAELGRLSKPYAVYNLRGVTVGVIGLGNLSSITSVFDQPNRPGITPLNMVETTQFYIDQLRSQGVDIMVAVSHVGLEDDIRMIQSTTGLDVVLGGHLHIVLNPTQEVVDCQAVNARGEHFIPQLEVARTSTGGAAAAAACGPEDCCDPVGVCRPAGQRAHWQVARGFRERRCEPRRVVLQHSGAFMKYLGRLDLVLSRDPQRISPARAAQYDNRDRYEVVSHRYTLFPVDRTVPEEPTMKRLLEPYARALDTLANLDTLVGYAPNDVLRTAAGGGDSPLGNLVSTSMWLRLGIQTDFSLTMTFGIRDNIPAGPVSIDQVFNVFPFDNSITTMNLSGREVQEMFDFVARRSAGRGCNSQAQIAGARVVLACGSCARADTQGMASQGCAETVNIGVRGDPAAQNIRCMSDNDCNGGNVAAVPVERRSLCEPSTRRCMVPLDLNASYAAAVNNYIAGGGSGFFVLQRNTTQVDTRVEQRDAVIDRVRQARPCGYDTANTIQRNRARGVTDMVALTLPQQPDDGLRDCRVDMDCAGPIPSACACPDRTDYRDNAGMCAPGAGRCVLRQCQEDVAALVLQSCPQLPGQARERCVLGAQARAALSCRILSCLDDATGAAVDGRLQMVSR
jgi:5'-nucleotidase